MIQSRNPVHQGPDAPGKDGIPVPGPVRPPHPEFTVNIVCKDHPADRPEVCCTGSLNIPAPVPGMLEPADPDNAVPAMIKNHEVDGQLPVIPELQDPAAPCFGLPHRFKDRDRRFAPGFHTRTPMMISGPDGIAGSFGIICPAGVAGSAGVDGSFGILCSCFVAGSRISVTWMPLSSAITSTAFRQEPGTAASFHGSLQPMQVVDSLFNSVIFVNGSSPSFSHAGPCIRCRVADQIPDAGNERRLPVPASIANDESRHA